MGYNEDLQSNNEKLQAVLEAVEALPDAADYVIGPETGTVGQALVVKELDEHGRPAKWETVDFPEGLPNPDDCVPGQPLVPYHTTEDGIPGGWAQQEFVPAVIGEKGQLPYWTGDWTEDGFYVWEPAFVPGVAEKPEDGQTLVYRIDWDSPTNEGSWEPAAPVLSVNGQKPDEYGAVRVGVTGDVVRPKDLQDYTPKHYLKTLGMLSEQDGSILPSISGEWADVAYGDGVTVMVASGTNIAARKVDGHLWEAVTLPRSGDWCSVVYFKPEKAFIAVDNSGYWALSFDMGATWVDGEEETGSPWISAGIWIAFSTDTMCVFQELTGAIMPSVFYLDATSDVYNGVVSVANPVIGPLVYGEDKFVVATGNQIGISTDIRYGEWEWVDLPEGVEINDIAYTDGLFMGHGYGKIYYSSDGITWEQHTDFASGNLVFPDGMTISGEIVQSIIACNGRFLFHVPLEWYGYSWAYWILSIPAHDAYAWDFMSINIPDISSMQIFTAGDRFLMLPTLQEDYVNWIADEPFAIYSDDGLGWTPNVPKLTAPSGGGSYSDWSDEEKATVVADVIAALPVYNGEVEDV